MWNGWHACYTSMHIPLCGGTVNIVQRAIQLLTVSYYSIQHARPSSPESSESLPSDHSMEIPVSFEEELPQSTRYTASVTTVNDLEQ